MGELIREKNENEKNLQKVVAEEAAERERSIAEIRAELEDLTRRQTALHRLNDKIEGEFTGNVPGVVEVAIRVKLSLFRNQIDRAEDELRRAVEVERRKNEAETYAGLLSEIEAL